MNRIIFVCCFTFSLLLGAEFVLRVATPHCVLLGQVIRGSLSGRLRICSPVDHFIELHEGKIEIENSTHEPPGVTASFYGSSYALGFPFNASYLRDVSNILKSGGTTSKLRACFSPLYRFVSQEDCLPKMVVSSEAEHKSFLFFVMAPDDPNFLFRGGFLNPEFYGSLGQVSKTASSHALKTIFGGFELFQILNKMWTVASSDASFAPDAMSYEEALSIPFAERWRMQNSLKLASDSWSLENATRSVSRVLSMYSNPTLILMPNLHFHRHFRHDLSLSEAESRPIFHSQYMILYLKLSNLLKNKKIPHIDMVEKLKAYPSEEVFLTKFDRHHTNETGYEILSQAIAAAILDQRQTY